MILIKKINPWNAEPKILINGRSVHKYLKSLSHPFKSELKNEMHRDNAENCKVFYCLESSTVRKQWNFVLVLDQGSLADC